MTSLAIRYAALILATAVAGSAPGAQARPFELGFFAGHSEGDGRLSLPFSHKQVKVRSTGRFADDGTLVLEQTVVEGDKPPRQREWRMKETGPNHYVGTLSDAAGPVTGERVGERLHLRFRTKSGMAVEQWLAEETDGRTTHNVLSVRKFGVVVARLHETIRRTD